MGGIRKDRHKSGQVAMKSKPEAVKYRNNRINDDLYTPYNGIFPLLQYIPKYSTVWECCDYGKSKITELLKKDGHNVISTDIIHGFDFLKDEPNFYFDMIITNPPYSLKDDFIAKCYQ